MYYIKKRKNIHICNKIKKEIRLKISDNTLFINSRIKPTFFQKLPPSAMRINESIIWIETERTRQGKWGMRSTLRFRDLIFPLSGHFHTNLEDLKLYEDSYCIFFATHILKTPRYGEDMKAEIRRWLKEAGYSFVEWEQDIYIFIVLTDIVSEIEFILYPKTIDESEKMLTLIKELQKPSFIRFAVPRTETELIKQLKEIYPIYFPEFPEFSEFPDWEVTSPIPLENLIGEG